MNEYTEVKHVHVDLTRDPEHKMFGVLLSEQAETRRHQASGTRPCPGVG